MELQYCVQKDVRVSVRTRLEQVGIVQETLCAVKRYFFRSWGARGHVGRVHAVLQPHLFKSSQHDRHISEAEGREPVNHRFPVLLAHTAQALARGPR